MPTTPKISIPNLDAIAKTDVKTEEALAKLQTYINANVAPAVGNKTPAPTFITPGVPPG